MAIKLMTLAFDTPYKPSPKVYLLALCDNANDQGTCFPSIATLSKKCSIGKTNITYLAKAYEDIDLINRKQRKRDNGSDASTLYIINISKLATIALSSGTERKRYLEEFETAYKKAKKPKEGVHSVNTTKNASKKQKVNRGVHQSEHLEPSINHQREDTNVSPLSKRASFLKSQNSFINYMRATFKNKTINTKDQYTGKKIQIAITDKGYLYDKNTGESFSGTRALEMWERLYEFAIKNPLLFLNQNTEETT